MDRRRFLRNATLGSMGLAAGCQSIASLSGSGSAMPEQPNILMILADDMGFSDVGCYGAEIDTPHIDRLADEGVRFTQFYNTARCSPSRASLLTGLYPHRAGVGHLDSDQGEPGYRGFLNPQSVTMAEALGRAGYFTACTGKWHVGYKREAQWPTRRGFDRFYGEHRYVDDYFKATNQLFLNGEKTTPQGEDWYSTDAYTDYMLRFMEEAQEKNQPFLGYLAYNAPHFPLQAFQKDIAKYKGRYGDDFARWRRQRYERQIEMGLIDERWALSEPSLMDGAMKQPETERVQKWLGVEHDNERWWDLKMAAYAAQIDRMDQNIGRVLRQLEETGELENTVIMFLSDNGGCAEDWINGQNPEGALPGDRAAKLAYGPPWASVSNTPFRYYKRWVHEGGIATPLVVRWPGVTDDRAGSLNRQMGHLIDLMPTCLAAAGADYPQRRDGQSTLPLDGRSLLPTLQDRSHPVHDTLYWEHEGNRAVRRGDWKLVSNSRFSEGEWELYDMTADRTETNDVIGQYPKRAGRLSRRYQRWAERSNVVPWEELTK